jgi:Ni,Fe-hydrogenase III component G
MWTLPQPRNRSREQLFLALPDVRRLVRHEVWRDADPAQAAAGECCLSLASDSRT